MTTFAELIDQTYATPDDTGEFDDRFIPEDRIWDGEREVASEHAAMLYLGGVYGMSAHDSGAEEDAYGHLHRVCYTCQTEDW